MGLLQYNAVKHYKNILTCFIDAVTDLILKKTTKFATIQNRQEKRLGNIILLCVKEHLK